MPYDHQPRPVGGLDDLDREVMTLFAQVSDSLAGATTALLSGDRLAARTLVDSDRDVDERVLRVEARVRDLVGQDWVGPTDMERLIAILQILPELERSADLAEHIAQRGEHDVGAGMSARSRGLVQRMAEVALEMWKVAADAYADRSVVAGEELDEADEELDILHESLTAELGLGQMSVPVAVEVTLLARFYERLGDHAVNLGRRSARLSRALAAGTSGPSQ